VAYSLPPLAVTGDVIPAAWGNDARNSIAETAVAKATTSGRIFRATGTEALAEVQDQAFFHGNAGGAVLPAANAAEREKVTVDTGGATRSDRYRLNFDDAVDEGVAWWIPLPPNVDFVTNIIVTIQWAAAAITGVVRFHLEGGAYAAGDDPELSAPAIMAHSFDASPNGVTNRLVFSTQTITGDTGWAAGEILQLGLFRLGTHVNDTMSGDAHIYDVTAQIFLAH